MKRDIIRKELIQLDWEVKDRNEFFIRMAEKLVKLGYVKQTFLDAILIREETYPTALPIQPYPVAIPHAEPENIIRPFIACTRLKHPVAWREMANNDVVHDVRFIFMLGFLASKEDADVHIDLLQLLVMNCQNGELMAKLSEAGTEDEYGELVMNMEGMND